MEKDKLEIKKYIANLLLSFHKVKSAELKQTRVEYNGIICSACPFSLGLKHFAVYGVVPCSAFSGVMHRLEKSSDCAMIKNGGWTKSRLLDEILVQAGEKAKARFLTKESRLKVRS